MCILFISRKKKSKWPLLIAANRDEYYSRGSVSPNFHWNDYPHIFAGKDKEAGGSWLGVNKYGLCVSILNRPSDIAPSNFKKSRGDLVVNALNNKNAVLAKDLVLKNFKKEYNFFNLFIADKKNAYWIKYQNYKIKLNPIPYGLSIIDNFNLNDKRSIRQKLNKTNFLESKLPDPDKNDYQDWKRLLISQKETIDEKSASIYVIDKENNYGTVSSSIIGLSSTENKSKGIFWLYRNSLSMQPKFKKLKMFS